MKTEIKRAVCEACGEKITVRKFSTNVQTTHICKKANINAKRTIVELSNGMRIHATFINGDENGRRM